MSNKQAAEAAFSSVEDELRETSTWMYHNPELMYQEFESSRRLSDCWRAKALA
jgi:metal-dependent amidase/aminoacylase/carboxypeptidase family protein